MTLAHAHGLRDPSGKEDTPARQAQWQALASAVTFVRRPGDPVVLMGDFNVLPDSEAFRIFEEIGLTDLVQARGHSDSRTSWYKKPQRYADYCLVSENVEVVAFDLPARPEVSDHRPIMLQLAI